MEKNYQMQKVRQSNFELLRIVSMFLIVMHHYAMHGGFYFLEGGVFSFPTYFVQVLVIGGKVGVNCFILISGFFLVDRKISYKKIGKIWGNIFFYSVLFFICAVITGRQNLNYNVLTRALFPVISNSYWFASTYIFMCIFSPYLSILIDNMSKEQMQKLIGVSIFLWCLFPTCWNLLPLDWKADFQFSTLTWFFTMFILGAYIRKHGADTNINRSTLALGGVVSLVFISATIILFDWLSVKYGIFSNSAIFFTTSNSVPIVTLSLALFLWFKNLNINCSRVINYVASTTFGIYLIHDNEYVRDFLWKELLRNWSYLESPYMIFHAVISICVVFCVCAMIEGVRISATKKISQYFSTRKS